jgi:hypothetical protein
MFKREAKIMAVILREDIIPAAGFPKRGNRGFPGDTVNSPLF